MAYRKADTNGAVIASQLHPSVLSHMQRRSFGNYRPIS